MILVFGSLNADLVFQVADLPRPGETVLCPSYVVHPGGKGANQAAAAAKAGGSVRMIGQVGPDSFGETLRQGLVEAGVDCTGVAVANQPTGVAVIGVDQAGENLIMVGSGANLATRANQVGDAELRPGTTLLCQNEVDPLETFDLIVRAAERGARTILNLAPAAQVPGAVLDVLDVLVVNEIEAAMAAGSQTGASQDADPRSLAGTLAHRHRLTCVVTLGGEGAIAREPDAGWRIDPLAIEPVDTTGAGDTFAGVLAATLDQGRTLPDALRRASVAAGLACTRLGAQTSQPGAADIESAPWRPRAGPTAGLGDRSDLAEVAVDLAQMPESQRIMEAEMAAALRQEWVQFG